MRYTLTPNSERAAQWLKKSRKTRTFTVRKGQLEFDGQNACAVAIALWCEGLTERDFRIQNGKDV